MCLMLAGVLLHSAWDKRSPLLPSPPHPKDPFSKFRELLHGDPYLQLNQNQVVLLVEPLLSDYQTAIAPARVALPGGACCSSSDQQVATSHNPYGHAGAEGSKSSSSSSSSRLNSALVLAAAQTTTSLQVAVAPASAAVAAAAAPLQAAAAAAVNWAWPGRRSSPNQFLKHALATHMWTLWKDGEHDVTLDASKAGG